MKKTIAAFMVIVLLCVVGAVSVKSLMKSIYPHKYEELIERYSAEYGVDPDLIYAVIRTESSFDPDATSSVGASGLMQIMPETLSWLCYRSGEDVAFESLHDPETSIRFGTYFLSLLQDEFGETETILAAYHAGRGKVNEWLSNPDYSEDGRTLLQIPYRDTAHYVSKVSRAMQIYKNLYKG